MSDGEYQAAMLAVEQAMNHIQDAHDLLRMMRQFFPCDHPEDEREVLPGSTMGNLKYRCKVCEKIIEDVKGREKK